MLYAREFMKKDEKDVLDMVDEIGAFDNNFEGLTNISSISNFDEFLTKLEKNKHEELIKPEYSPQTTFGVFDGENLIGGFNLRHCLKGDLIHHGGNIGYLIRPSARGKGYGTQLLALALEKAQEIGLEEVLISCRSENIASKKVIENNGGLYDNDYYDEVLGINYRRYWIQLEKKLKR